MIATGGTELATMSRMYVVCSKSHISRDYDETRRLVSGDGPQRGRSAASLFLGVPKNGGDGTGSKRLQVHEGPFTPPVMDALIQLEAAVQLVAIGRHEQALEFASNAVTEMPSNEALFEWEARLLGGCLNRDFDTHTLVFGERRAEANRETSVHAEPQ